MKARPKIMKLKRVSPQTVSLT